MTKLKGPRETHLLIARHEGAVKSLERAEKDPQVSHFTRMSRMLREGQILDEIFDQAIAGNSVAERYLEQIGALKHEPNS